jgi:hypothetical protein
VRLASFFPYFTLIAPEGEAKLYVEAFKLMIIYEITATVHSDVTAEYERYMVDRHIPDVLAAGGFLTAEMSRSDNCYRIRYLTDDRSILDAYLAGPADEMRADFIRNLPSGVKLEREIWEVVAELAPPV